MIHPLLKNAGSLDFSDAKLAKGFGTLIINNANLLGWGVGNPIAAPTRSEMLRIGKTWLEGVTDSVKYLSAADALSLLDTYNFVYRIIYSSAPDTKFTYSIASNALEARIHGDKGIDVYELYRVIDKGINSGIELYKDKPLKWLSIMLDSWHQEFNTGRYIDPKPSMTYAGRFVRITDKDILARVSVLINANLFAFEEDQKAFKRHLFDNHRHYLDKLLHDGGADYDIPTLMTIGSFIHACFTMLTTHERDGLKEAAATALYNKTDSPYIRASIELIREAEKQYNYGAI